MKRVVALFAVVAVLPGLLGAQPSADLPDLPEKYRKWLEEEVAYIITEREREVFLGLYSTDEREAFLDAFWRRRDPDPLTPVNELREEHYRRLEHANRVLGRETPIPGYLTDRGRMYIILGEPRDRESFLGAPGIYPAEVWFYDKDPARGLSYPFYLLFFQQGFSGEYRLYSPRIHGPEKLFPALQFGENSRMEAYRLLQNISAELAHASITFRADEGAIPGLIQDSLSTDILLAEIARSPTRAVDTRYLDAIGTARGLVESDYLFNYVPSEVSVDVLPGPSGLEEASFVHWGIEIEPQHLTLVLDEKKKVYYTSLEIHGEVTTVEAEAPVVQFTREEFLELSTSQFAEVEARPFAYRSMFPVLPGDFRFRVILKNRARNQYTILESELRIPERGPGEVHLGRPVLLYGREPAADGRAQDYRPYQLGAERLDPNTKKVFAVGQDLLALIPLAGAAPDDRLTLELFEREGGSVGEPRSARIGSRPVVIESLPLVGLVGGRYRLAVRLTDPGGASLGESSADFDLSPRSAISRPWSLRWAGLDVSVGGVIETALAEQYLRLGDRESARRLYERALTRNGSLAAPRLVLGRLLLDERNPREAVELLAPLAESDPGNPEVLRTLGDAYFQSGEPARALPYFEKVLSLSSPEPSLLNALGACQASVGNRTQAISYLERSLSLAPDQADVRALLDELRRAVPE